VAPALVAVGLLMLALPASVRRVGRRLPAREWARLCLVALLGGALLLEAGLILLAAPTVLRALGIAYLAEACDRLVGPLMPLGAMGGWAAAALATGMGALAIQGWRRAAGQVRRLAIEGCLGTRAGGAGYELVVLPTAECVAYSVDDPIRQVVVSQGVLDVLEGPQVDAVIAHEWAHLRLGHPRLLLMAAAVRQALRWWPPVTGSHAALRAALERWADDEATPHAAARGQLRAALVTLTAVELGGGVPAFSLADATLERIEAMDQPPRAPLGLHALLYAPGLASVVVAIAATGAWTEQARLVIAMAGRCTA
jgi:Zn-dependent protease with chaperone function